MQTVDDMVTTGVCMESLFSIVGTIQQMMKPDAREKGTRGKEPPWHLNSQFEMWSFYAFFVK